MTIETLSRPAAAEDLAATMAEIGRRARVAAGELALAPAAAKTAALRRAAAVGARAAADESKSSEEDAEEGDEE